MKVHAVIVAAGKGSRTGRSRPKQFDMLAGRPVYSWSLETFLSHPHVSSVALVVPPSENCQDASTSGGTRDSGLITCKGGETRSQSVLNGIAALDAANDDIVLIHDAARPGLAMDLIDVLLEALKGADAATPALPVSDALKLQRHDGLNDVPRDGLYRVQTPQAFRVGLIRQALSENGADFVDDLAAVEARGATVTLVRGSERLNKITYEEDFAILEALLSKTAFPEFRTGSGYDVHALTEGDGVTLCGVRIPHDMSLSGHSDADVGWHALTDAIFGALSLGDLGDHFPPSDDKWKGADSGIFLKHATRLAAERGWNITNADITLICEAPKIKPYRQAMQERTAGTLGVAPEQVSIKATTTEGLGFTGRREGIAAQAVIMLGRPAS